MKKVLILLALIVVLVVGCTQKSCPAFSDTDRHKVSNTP
jgi:outer membrane lipoprotein-sorting protein